MNFDALSTAGHSVLFKLAASQGGQVIDYQVFRNIFLILVASIHLGCSGLSPRDFPWKEKKYVLFWRCIAGQLVFFIFNVCLTLVPLTFQMIIF